MTLSFASVLFKLVHRICFYACMRASQMLVNELKTISVVSNDFRSQMIHLLYFKPLGFYPRLIDWIISLFLLVIWSVENRPWVDPLRQHGGRTHQLEGRQVPSGDKPMDQW